MLLAKKSLVESEIGTLKTMISFSSANQGNANATLDALKQTVDDATHKRDNKTREAIEARHECLRQSAENTTTNNTQTEGGACSKLKDATEDAVDSAFTQAQANSQYLTASFTLQSKEQFNSFLGSRVSALEKELQEIESDLQRTEPYLGPIAQSHQFEDLNKLLNETEQNLDDEWLQFEYDSDSTHISTSQTSTSVNVAVGLSVSEPDVLGFGGSANIGKTDVDLRQAIRNADLKVAGELLRVNIKRPWFKPSIFDDSTLFFVSSTKLISIVQQHSLYFFLKGRMDAI